MGWGFLTSARIAIWGWLIPCWGREGYSVRCRMFGSIPGPARGQKHLSPSSHCCGNHRCLQCQMSSRRQNQTGAGHDERGSWVPQCRCLGSSRLRRAGKWRTGTTVTTTKAAQTKHREQSQEPVLRAYCVPRMVQRLLLVLPATLQGSVIFPVIQVREL